jgi:hypothetical protein
MLGIIASLICLVWAIEAAAALLMYAWVLCKRRRWQPGPALGQEPNRLPLPFARRAMIGQVEGTSPSYPSAISTQIARSSWSSSSVAALSRRAVNPRCSLSDSCRVGHG